MNNMINLPEQHRVAPAVEQLLEVFRAELRGVQFPGVDTGVLDAASAGVHAAAAELERCAAALDAARAALAVAEDELLARAQRALAYARVYAEDVPTLLGALDAISLPRGGHVVAAEAAATSAARVGAPSRRGRPPRRVAPASLFAPAGAGDQVASVG